MAYSGCGEAFEEELGDVSGKQLPRTHRAHKTRQMKRKTTLHLRLNWMSFLLVRSGRIVHVHVAVYPNKQTNNNKQKQQHIKSKALTRLIGKQVWSVLQWSVW